MNSFSMEVESGFSPKRGEDENGKFFLIDDIKAYIISEESRGFSSSEVITFAIPFLSNVGAGVVANYCWEQIKKRRVSSLSINNSSPIKSEDDILVAIKIDEEKIP